MKVIPSEQHGFCLGASTTTQLVDSTFDWTTALSNKNSVDIIYLDLSKAFDKVSHIKLLSKIANLGISTQVLMWLKDYLSKRHMYVKVGYDYSDRFSCHSGVPQGGVLSPLLFIVYCYDLPDGLKTHPNVKIQIYSDDINIYGNYNEQSKDEVHSAVSESLRRMVDWANSHGIPINLNKSTVFHIGKSFSGEYSVNGTILIKSNLAKDLGVLFDSRMQFTNLIDHITKKALSTLFTILRNVHTNDQHVLLRLYKSYVLPHLEYCSQIWNPHTKKLQRKVERVQQIFTRILFYRTATNLLPSLPSYKIGLKHLSLQSLLYRRVFNYLSFCFRILRLHTKLRASKYWGFRISRARTGGLGLYCKGISTVSNNIIFNTFFRRGARWMNMLRLNIVNSANLATFKKKLRKLDLLRLLKMEDY
ncbi:hypothetical protein Y032_0007g3290 [Ancylostoma ceylanicum]|nr:hypothetical protein Y032_0007g3290 [Ancylostoma ceylanicum]